MHTPDSNGAMFLDYFNYNQNVDIKNIEFLKLFFNKFNELISYENNFHLKSFINPLSDEILYDLIKKEDIDGINKL